MRLEINVHDDRKIVEIWLSHSEQADAALREQLRPIYQEYNLSLIHISEPTRP